MNLPVENIENLEKVNTQEINNFLNSILNFLSYILDNKFLIFISLFLPTLVASLLLYFAPPTFTATSSFVCPPPEILVGSYQELSATSSISLGSFGSFLKDPADIYLELLKSRNINRNIIEKFGLLKQFNAKDYETAFQSIPKIIKVENNKGVISVIITTTNAKLSSDIANEYVEQMSKFLSSSNITAAKNERLFLEKRLSQVHKNLIDSSKTLSNFQSAKKMLDVEKQSQEIIRAVGQLLSKIVETEAEIEGLKVIYTEKSPKISALREKVALLKGEMDKLKGTAGQESESTLGAQMSDMPSFAVNYVELVRNVKIQEVVFELLSKQFELVKLKEAKEKITIKVIDKARVPDKKSGPKIKITVLIVFTLCFLLTLIYIFIKYQLNNLYKLYPETKANMKKFKLKIIGL